MFWTDPTAETAAWQHLWVIGKHLVEQLQDATQDGSLGAQTVSSTLLDAQIALLQQCLAGTEAQLGRAEAGETAATRCDWTSLLATLCWPPVSPASLRRFEIQSLHAYRELLKGYLTLLEEARGMHNPSRHSAPREGKVPIH